ncbi:MAG: hypothetical protein JSW11_11125 [Candidatus Heimdallarchaeota archaeon]|nr:MAG: hypothetical protein JSW11_11125 [Candidatus Heimdallarchaeota archaeon]
MRKKFSFMIAISIFLLLLVPSIGIAEVDEDVMEPGDTFIYEVTEFDVPWEDLLGGMEAPFPMEDFVLDLAGSTLGVKVMAVDANDGFYALNAYVVLGRSIEIPIPEESLTPDVEEIFGDAFIIPKGVGMGIGTPIPGSDFLEFIAEDFDGQYAGLPFYLDANEWSQYEDDLFDELAEQLEDAGVDLTTEEKEGEFIVTIEGHVGEGAELEYTTEYTTTEPWWWTEETSVYYPEPVGGPEIDADITLEVAWFASGDHAGVFKRVTGSFDGDIGDETNVEMNVEVAFESKRHNPLPDEILDEETITLEMAEATFDYTPEGWFDAHQDFKDQLDEMQDTIDDADGEDIFEFEVTDVDGCFYETDVSVYDGNNLEQMEEPLWWNGFIGSPCYDYGEWSSGPYRNWQLYPFSSNGIIPLIAPGITPDWDMWQASTLTISSIVELLEEAVTASEAEDALGDIGITLDKLDVTYEIRGNNEYKFFYFTGELDVVFDSTQAAEWPSEDPEEPYVEVTATIEMWLGYTTKGLIVSMGIDLLLDAMFEEFPFGSEWNEETYEYEPIYDDGSIQIEFNAEIVNKDIDNIPDPTKLPKDTEGEDGDGGGLPTPGFSIIPALVLVAAVSVIIKRRK